MSSRVKWISLFHIQTFLNELLHFILGHSQLGSFLGGLVVKNLSAMQEKQEMRVQSPGWENHLEKDKAIHSSILAWRIPWTEESGRLQSIESQRVEHDWSDLASMHSLLTMLWQFQVNSRGTQPCIYKYPFSPRCPSHPGCHVTLNRVPWAV